MVFRILTILHPIANCTEGESTIEAVVVADDVKKDKKKKRKLEPEANGEVVAMHIIQRERLFF